MSTCLVRWSSVNRWLVALVFCVGASMLLAAVASAMPAVEEKLTASDGAKDDQFGHSVGLSGDLVVAGAPFDDHSGLVDPGSAYVFERAATGGFVEVAKVTASDAVARDEFGRAVAISGDVIVVGAPFDDHAGGLSAGSAYVFERTATGAFVEVTKLISSDSNDGDTFGFAVAISGDRIVVGAHLDDHPGGNGAGSAYVFERSGGGGFVEVAKLTAADATDNDLLGVSVAISGSRVVAGATQESVGGQNSGAAYVFEPVAGGGYTQVAKLKASDVSAGDFFASSVAVSGDRIVVSGVENDDAGNGSGSAYVFEPAVGGGFTEVAKLTASDAAAHDEFGSAVGVSGDRIVVTAQFDNNLGGNDAGAAYVFEPAVGGGFDEVEKFTPSDPDTGDFFGTSVFVSGDRAVVGVPADDLADRGFGSAYILDYTPSCVAVPQPESMRGWWSFESNWQDRAGAYPAAVATGSAGFAPGAVGDAGSFDGGTASIGAGADLDLDAGDGLTLDMWVKRDSASGNGVEVLLGHRNSTAGSDGFLAFLFDGRPHLQLRNTATTVANFGAPTLSVPKDGQFHFVAMTVQPGGDITYIVDGQVETRPAPVGLGSLDNPSEALHFGNDFDGTDPFRGDLDEVEIFASVLSPAELGLIRDAGSSGKCEPAGFCNAAPATINLATNGGNGLGTPDADVIVGTAGDDVIIGMGGDDIICGLEGNDTINGGPGADLMFGDDGNDTVFGLAGNDTLYGGTGNDELIGFGDDDTLYGEAGLDTLNGGPGNDDLFGGDDADQLFGQAGDDYLLGGVGNDFILGLDGVDTIDGGAGDDTVNAGTGADVVVGGDGNDRLFAGSGNDQVDGDAGDDQIFGQVGFDTVDGGVGNDMIWGNEDDDVITDPSGTNTINAGPGNDTVTGGSGVDTIFGDGNLSHAGDDTIDGGLGSDLILGFAGMDTITATDGVADIVNGGPDVDICTVDPGIDTAFNCP